MPRKLLARSYFNRPTLTVALGRFNLEIKRGLIYRCRRVLKDKQFENYRAAGIDTPLTARFRLGMELDPGMWGSHVVLKPMHINSHGEICLDADCGVGRAGQLVGRRSGSRSTGRKL